MDIFDSKKVRDQVIALAESTNDKELLEAGREYTPHSISSRGKLMALLAVRPGEAPLKIMEDLLHV